MQQGRNPVPDFDSDERLFRRCDPDHILDDGKVLKEAFKFPAMSVVRSGDGSSVDQFHPIDAKWTTEEYPGPEGRLFLSDSAVVQIRVGDVPTKIERPEGKPYDLRLVHVPYGDHFPHSEVRIFKDGLEVTSESKIKVRDQLRQAFADVAVPCLELEP